METATNQPVDPRVAAIGVGACLKAVRRSDGPLLYRRTWREGSVDPDSAPVWRMPNWGQIETCRRARSWAGSSAGAMPMLDQPPQRTWRRSGHDGQTDQLWAPYGAEQAAVSRTTVQGWN
jgi:hypothetical protein